MYRFIIVLIAAAMLLMLVACEREITGNFETVENASFNCLECHHQDDHELARTRTQFENSAHGSGENSDHNRHFDSGDDDCERCHTSEGFLAHLEGEDPGGDEDVDFTTISCYTCHDYHATGEFDLRTTAAVELANGESFDKETGNLCAACHHSRRDVSEYVTDDVELDDDYDPHASNQADMLQGTNAYEYDGYDYENSFHQGFSEGCVLCHMSNSAHESIGGHSLNMRNQDREFQNLTGCNVSECHRGNMITFDRRSFTDIDGDGRNEGIQTEITGLLDTLQVLLVSAGLLEYDADDLAYVPVEDRLVSTADSVGALYNYIFVVDDGSRGIHNADYAAGLLTSAINFMSSGDPNGAPPNAPPSPLTLSAH